MGWGWRGAHPTHKQSCAHILRYRPRVCADPAGQPSPPRRSVPGGPGDDGDAVLREGG